MMHRMISLMFGDREAMGGVLLLVLLQGMSLCLALLVMYGHRKSMLRRARFVKEVEGDRVFVRHQTFALVLLWVYVLSTVLFAIVSSALFILRPHWL